MKLKVVFQRKKTHTHIYIFINTSIYITRVYYYTFIHGKQKQSGKLLRKAGKPPHK